MSKVLELLFANQDGKVAKINIDEPKENLTSTEISQAMDAIINANIFTSQGGSFISKKGARIVERIVTEYAIVE